MKKITILTPAYNRAFTLQKLYDSLVRQTNKDFEWLVVDDGSTDETRKMIDCFINEKKISIRYIYQINGGKHRALNTGIQNINSPLTFIVDSDDYLLDNAIEEIIKADLKYSTNHSICGYSFLRVFPDLSINGAQFSCNEYISDYISCRLNEKVEGDKAEVYRTENLKEFPFLEIEGEKFLFEDYVWIQMAEKYKTVHFNIPIYVGDYLEDGLSKNISKIKFTSPKGMMERGRIMCSKKCAFISRCKGMMQYIAFGHVAEKSYNELYKNIKYKMLFILMFLPANVYLLKLNKEQRQK